MSRNEELIELFPELNTENTPFEDSMDKMLLSNRTVFLYGEIDEV